MDISVNVTVPKSLLDMDVVQNAIERVMTKKTSPQVTKLFNKTVDGWSNKPSFRSRFTKTPNYLSERIWAEGGGTNSRGLSADDQYQMVNYGTPPHRIPKSGTTFMRFNWGGPGSYTPATKPGIIKSGPRAKNGPVVTKYVVNHPGIEDPRRFDIAIRDEYEPTFRDDIQIALTVAAVKTAAENNK